MIGKIIGEALGIFGTIFLVLGFYIRREHTKLRRGPINKTSGQVIRYLQTIPFTPIVSYHVEGKNFEQTLTYTKIKYAIGTDEINREDFFSPTLTISKKEKENLPQIMQQRFPLETKLNIFYETNYPENSYIERFAKKRTDRTFFLMAAVCICCMVVVYFVFK